jgi:hypothetical protein
MIADASRVKVANISCRVKHADLCWSCWATNVPLAWAVRSGAPGFRRAVHPPAVHMKDNDGRAFDPYEQSTSLAGTAITTIAMFLLSRLDVDTPPALASVYMLGVGVGSASSYRS